MSEEPKPAEPPDRSAQHAVAAPITNIHGIREASKLESLDRRKPRHASPAEKAKAILRVLAGEDKEQVAADLKIQVDRLERWQTTFVHGGMEALERSATRKSSRSTLSEKTKLRTGGTLPQWILLLAILVAAIMALVWLLTP